ncbi:MAG: methyltransferase domain-containing protein [Candidatus Omnitrophica bacterium]|nr:methyltransferase domain-containing protein [Candidatus Omnitrophota bacterium]
MGAVNYSFVMKRLWQYLNLYYLKPFDAVNDTLTASLLTSFNWDGDVVELGSGDGEFTYIMHGGSFPLWFDRYLMVDMGNKDIFDTHKADVVRPERKLNYPRIRLAVDAKESHVQKIKEIGFAEEAQVAAYEQLPIADHSVEKIFYYTPHGLQDHDAALREASRILKPGGRMLILRYSEYVKTAFVCYVLSRKMKSRFWAEYFKKLDNGRHDEISSMARSEKEWIALFAGMGLRILREERGLSPLAWNIYDIQTRPLLKGLIRFFNLWPRGVRTILKFFWMVCWYPVIFIFYILFSNRIIGLERKSCYSAFEIVKL